MDDATDMVTVGLVVRAHGVQGEVAVIPETENPARFERGSELFARTDQLRRRLRVLSSRPHKGRHLVRFAETPDREAAESLRGAVLEAPTASVPVAEEGTFYYFQLIGCRVVDHKLGDLGEVVDVVEDGGGLLLAMSPGRAQGAVGQGGTPAGAGSRRPLLIPFVRELLPVIDMEARLIRTELPDGLREACESTS